MRQTILQHSPQWHMWAGLHLYQLEDSKSVITRLSPATRPGLMTQLWYAFWWLGLRFMFFQTRGFSQNWTPAPAMSRLLILPRKQFQRPIVTVCCLWGKPWGKEWSNRAQLIAGLCPMTRHMNKADIKHSFQYDFTVDTCLHTWSYLGQAFTPEIQTRVWTKW